MVDSIIYVDEVKFHDGLVGKVPAKNLDFEQKFKYWEVHVQEREGAYAVVTSPEPVLKGNYALKLISPEMVVDGKFKMNEITVKNVFTPDQASRHAFDFIIPFRIESIQFEDAKVVHYINVTVTNGLPWAHTWFFAGTLFISFYTPKVMEADFWFEVGVYRSRRVTPLPKPLPFGVWNAIRLAYDRFTRSAMIEIFGDGKQVLAGAMKAGWLECHKEVPPCAIYIAWDGYTVPEEYW